MPVLPAQAQSATAAQNTADLQNALRRIARNSNDSSALADAGLAALKMGDTRAAIGFLAKADQIYPRSGRVKVGLGKALLAEENPFGALRYFEQALSNGIPLRSIAADRGLAYDLIGRNADAQKDYELAMRYGSDDQLLKRYAVSLGISGDVAGADLKLNPLLQKSDRGAWRDRAFILAMNGKKSDANSIARQTMPRNLANAIKPFFDRMPKLTAAQKAAAVHFGHFPASENIGVDVASVRYAANSAVRGGSGADAGLIPLGQPLGDGVKKPRVLAMPDKKPRRRPGSRSSDRRKSKQNKSPDKTKVVKLATNTLPIPTNARPLVKPAVQKSDKPAGGLREELGLPPANASSASRSDSQKPSTKKPEPKSVATTTVSNPDTSLGSDTASASLETPGGAWVAGIPESKTSGIKTVAGRSEPKPLVSQTVERKVAIGNSKPAVTPPPTKPEPKPIQTASQKSSLEQTNANQKKPVQLAAFDLAKSVPAPAASKPQVANAAPARKSLADIMGGIAIPDAEKKAEVVPVDLSKIEPAKPKPKVKPPEKKQTAKAEPKKKPEVKHPKRYWVQIATGRNTNALKYDYRRMSKKHGRLFSGKSGWTSPWGRTNRLVVGPFDNLSAAKKFEGGFRKGGGDGFAWVSSQGTEVNKLTK